MSNSIQIVFDEVTGKKLRMMSNSTIPDGNSDEAKAGEVSWVEKDPAIIEQILQNDVELQNGQLVFTPKAPPSLDVLKQRKLAAFKTQVAPGVAFERAPDYKQRNVGMAIYDAATTTSIINWVKAVRSAVDETETAILTATDETALDVVDVTADSLRARAESIFTTL
ncbi:MAG: hypothetical protein M0021_09785 [Clostridia bacterium]|nr:hypothetical protein [Clostridia bacterium]